MQEIKIFRRRRDLTLGKCYLINNVNDGKWSPEGITCKKDRCNTDYIFKFVDIRNGKYCFVEINGGWSRTYAPAQLIGKKFMEVLHD